MSNNAPKVFVIILNWNRPHDTVACLNSLEKTQVKGFNYSAIVVDNGSTDNSVSMFEKINNQKLIIIKNKNNLGFAEGNNVGIKEALDRGADYVVILNNDTLVDPGLISELLKAFQEEPKAGLISPKIYFARGFEFHKRYKEVELGRVIWYAGGDIDWKNVYGANHGVDEVDEGQFDKTYETDFATGACFMAKAEVLKRVGLFNKEYFMYFEDADLSQRMKKAGWKVLYSPKGKLWHKVAQSSGIGGELNDYFITRNRMLFGLKYAPLRAKLALLRESLKLITKGRKWQNVGIRDFYLGRLGKGSWK